MKKYLLTLATTSILSCSSVFAEGFYAKAGIGGSLSMKPDILSKGDSTLTPSAYVGFGMEVIDSVRVGIEACGWLNNAKIADKLEAGDHYVLKDTPFAISLVGSYDYKISDTMTPYLSIRAGYAHSTLGFEHVKDPKIKEGAKKEAMLKNLEFAPFTCGGSLGLGFKVLDNMSVDIAYNFDFYKTSPTKESKAHAQTDKIKNAVEKEDGKIYANKISAGITYKF